jgi:adenosylcobinamide kinase/adenosylcobinamide-phosphate guanylyltransferase
VPDPGSVNPGLPGYPLSLRLDGRLAVVAGGGAAAAREVAALREAGAAVLVVAADLSAPLAEQADRGLIAVRRGRYQAADLNGAWLALACADQPDVNAAVAADAARLQVWCVTPDAAPVHPLDSPAQQAAGQPTAAARVLVLGGARSGKSTTAENFLAARGEIEYVATGLAPSADDAEWAARVAAHRGRRPAHWRTTETLDLEKVLASGDPAPVLIDCLSLWLARVMDECGAWDDAGDGSAAPGGRGIAAVAARMDRLLDAWRATSRLVVAVSNEVGCGVVPATASGRLYRDVLGRLNALVAAGSDEVWFCTAGLPRRLR